MNIVIDNMLILVFYISLSNFYFLKFWSLLFLMFILKRERDRETERGRERERAGEGQRERETENLKQAPCCQRKARGAGIHKL